MAGQGRNCGPITTPVEALVREPSQKLVYKIPGLCWPSLLVFMIVRAGYQLARGKKYTQVLLGSFWGS